MQRFFSSLRKKFDQIIKKETQKKQIIKEQPINFKPQIRTVYNEESQITPYDEYRFTITKRNEIPDYMFKSFQENPEPFKSPKDSKCLHIALYGSQNSGKSSLMNSLINKYISAVSNKRFTTYLPVIGIRTFEDIKTQLVFHDLPSYNLSKINQENESQILSFKHLNMNINKIDRIAIVLDCTRSITPNQIKQLSLVQRKYGITKPIDLILNKIDICYNKRKLQDLNTILESRFNFQKKLIVSTQTNYGIQQVIDYYISLAEEKKWNFPSKLNSMKSEIQIIQDHIRSGLYERYFQELPYGIQIEIFEFSIKSDLIIIGAQLNCERKIHKSMLIGKKGQNIQFLQNHIEKNLAIYYGKPIKLLLDVVKGVRNENETEYFNEEQKFIEEKKEINKIKNKNKQIYKQ